MADTETLPKTRATTGTTRLFVPLPRRDDTDDARRLPVRTEDAGQPPRETVQVLEAARDALFKLIGSIFAAVGKIVSALIDLVQEIGGKETARAVDRAAADVLDRVIPGDQRPQPGAPTGLPHVVPAAPTNGTPQERFPPFVAQPGATPPGAPPTDLEAAIPPSETVPPADRPAGAPVELSVRVRGILEEHAASDAERLRITPAFVDLVTLGVSFMVNVEAMAPGSVRALLATDLVLEPATAASASSEQTEAPSTPPEDGAAAVLSGFMDR